MTERVTIEVPKWGRYVSDQDLFDAQMLRTRADLLREVLDRCVEETGDSTHLRSLRKIHLAGMLADFATGNRENECVNDSQEETAKGGGDLAMPETIYFYSCEACGSGIAKSATGSWVDYNGSGVCSSWTTSVHVVSPVALPTLNLCTGCQRPVGLDKLHTGADCALDDPNDHS